MKISHLVLLFAGVATSFVVTSKSQAQVPVIKIDGSSTVFPITEAVAEEFQTSQRGKVRVTVGISGTGGGFKKFCRGETDVQNASRPIQTSEMEACKAAGIKYLELPIAYDATAVVVNPKNTWITQMTVEELKTIWQPEAQGKIMKWNQVNPKWANEEIKLFGAGADSGTFDYFTEAIVGKAKSSRGDYTASEDDNTLVTGIAGAKGALGYVPLAYYEENKTKLKIVAIVGGAKAPKPTAAVIPQRSTVESGEYFPLSRPIFIYVSEAAMKKAEVKTFTEFYLKESPKLVPAVKYVALPQKAYDLAIEHVKKNKLGTAFGGHSEVGLKIEDLLKREGSL
jgi:phosphate transport system substrate-binding protein